MKPHFITTAVAFRAGKEHSRKFSGRNVCNYRIIAWLDTINARTANVRVTEWDGTRWNDHGERRVDTPND